MTDLVIRNAALFDGRRRIPRADAVLVRDGLIAAVGTGLDSAGATVLDAGGGLLTPSFTDGHLHPMQGGMELGSCDLSDSPDLAAAIARVVEYARGIPDGEWVVAGGWGMWLVPGGRPTRHLLDEALPGRAVYLVSADRHTAWLSTEALRRAGIDAATPEVAGGVIDREPGGEPAGTLHERAMNLAARLLPAQTLETQVAGIEAARRHLRQFGITGWQDALVGTYGDLTDSTDAYLATRSGDGGLRARVSAALWMPRELTVDQVPDAVAELVAKRRVLETAPGGGAAIVASTVKLMIDGIIENGTAALAHPYCGTDVHGDLQFDEDVLFAVVRELGRTGFAIHAHTIGDRALTRFLDAVEAAPRTATRKQVAHLQLADARDIPRMAAARVGANLQMLWACDDTQAVTIVKPRIGEDRYRAQYPFRSFATAGVALAAGSDWPVSSGNPWDAIEVAVRRVVPGGDGPALAPRERLSLGQALAAYTSGSAAASGFDTGRIRVGAAADLALHDVDPFEVAVDELHRTRVVESWLAGVPSGL